MLPCGMFPNEKDLNVFRDPFGDVWEQVKKDTAAIRLLREAGIEVKLNCSLTPHNAEDLPKIVEFANQNHLILQVATYMFPPVRKNSAMTGQNDRFSPEDAAYYMAYADYLLLGRE